MIKKLVDFFSCFTILPVDIQDIIDMMVENGVKDAISIYPVEMDDGIVRGFTDQYSINGGLYNDGPRQFADIYFSESMPEHWRRLVCCKELIHIFDHPSGMAYTREVISKLITEVVSPREVAAMSYPGAVDHGTLFAALALLFPWDARENLLVPYQANKIGPMDIAKMAKIPARYVPFLMSDIYAQRYNEWIGRLK